MIQTYCLNHLLIVVHQHNVQPKLRFNCRFFFAINICFRNKFVTGNHFLIMTKIQLISGEKKYLSFCVRTRNPVFDPIIVV